MIRAVLDANIFLSGVIGIRRSGSPPGEVLRQWYREAFVVVVSRPLIDEVLRTLDEPWFLDRVDKSNRTDVIEALSQYAEHCLLDEIHAPIASHPEDDLILATAVSGCADVLVAGDKQLLALASHQGVPIVDSRSFLALLSGRPRVDNN